MSEHSTLAKELFTKGYNCSQSVVLAFCDETGLDSETALKFLLHLVVEWEDYERYVEQSVKCS